MTGRDRKGAKKVSPGAGGEPAGATVPQTTPPPTKPRTQPQPSRQPDQGAAQGFERQRLEPANHPPASTRDEQNIAGEKDFELGPPGR